MAEKHIDSAVAVASSSSSDSGENCDREDFQLEGACAPNQLDSNTASAKMNPEEACAAPMASGGEGAVDKLLQQQIQERMFELRRLQLGDRPVTGQGHKEAVENFFARNTQESTSEDSEQHRPEEVIVEVRGLVESRPVSSILQSSNFRRSLERALRSGLAGPSTGARNASQNSRTSNTTTTTNPRRALLQSIRQRRNSAGHIELSGGSSRAESPVPVVPSNSEPEAAPRTSDDLLNVPRIPAPVRAQSWLAEQPAPVQEQGAPAGVWESLEQAQRESIISEISDLVHRQLVTSTLNSGFRNSLESTFRDRVLATGTNGARVENFIRTLPTRSPDDRNNFADLGIDGPQMAALSDDAVSVISATAAVAVPYAQSSSAMRSELQSLRAQLQEMKNMMRLSFDLQLDIQRSIKQEVAAALSQALGGATAAPPAPTPPVNDTHCLICLDKHSDCVLYQCGHMCVCYPCGLTLKQRGAHCPVCRAPIKDVIRAYKCNQE